MRLFGQGLDIIEVSDDGNGVPLGSRPYMATRHATSKIESIDEIYQGVRTVLIDENHYLFIFSIAI